MAGRRAWGPADKPYWVCFEWKIPYSRSSFSTPGDGMNSAAGFFHPFAESAKHGLPIGALPSVQRFDGLHQPRF
jgi:hypothetical protein